MSAPSFESRSSPVTVFVASRIRTMDPSRPETDTHVAVRDGRILAIGSGDDISGWGPHNLDTSFADKTLLPGFVEGHAHAFEGANWRWTYCGFFDRSDGQGRVWEGLKSTAAVIDRLRLHTPPTGASAIVGFGYDPIYFRGSRCSRHDLDAVSTDASVIVLHASGHIVNVNTAVLERLGWLRNDIDLPGVIFGDDGLPNGELRGPAAQAPAQRLCGVSDALRTPDREALWAFARVGVSAGVTTCTDLAGGANDDYVQRLVDATTDPAFPIRLVPATHVQSVAFEQLVEKIAHLKSLSNNKLRFGQLKAHADGSIQGFSARLRWPGYFNGEPNGMFYIEPELLREVYALALENGIQVHTHTNGDEAIDLAIECFSEAVQRHPRNDHRFVLQHCQLANRAQLERMAELRLCANFFANHHFYWGDEHYRTTVGPDRAERMNPCRSAGELGVRYAIHSDAPVTPLRPLHVAWCAATRETASGRELGAYERIGVYEALRAVTLGAAYTLKLDHEIGSIAVGKRADFAVLHDDPLAAEAVSLRDVRVWGTVLNGVAIAGASQVGDAPAIVASQTN